MRDCLGVSAGDMTGRHVLFVTSGLYFTCRLAWVRLPIPASSASMHSSRCRFERDEHADCERPKLRFQRNVRLGPTAGSWERRSRHLFFDFFRLRKGKYSPKSALCPKLVPRGAPMKKLVLETTSPFQGLPELVA